MSDLENKQPVTGPGSAHEALQLQLTLQLLALTLLAATVAFYFYGQQRRARFDLTVIKPPALAIIQGFEQEKPTVDAFLAKIAKYGTTHPDFAPIIQKYGIQNPTNAPAAPAAKPVTPTGTAPAAKPAPAPAPKK